MDMSNDEKQSFIRWQGRTIEQLGFVNNLLIFLATGMSAFQVQLAIKEVSFTIFDKRTIVLSTLLIFTSLMFGCYLALNRLHSFQLTSQVARKRETGKRGCIEDLRNKVKTLDKRTWWLLLAQTFSFGLGAFLLVIFAIIHLIE
jgi:hypothetical protein